MGDIMQKKEKNIIFKYQIFHIGTNKKSPFFYRYNEALYSIKCPTNFFIRLFNILKTMVFKKKLYPMDFICLSFLNIIVLLLIFFQNNIENWINYTLCYSLFSIVICFIISFHNKFPNQRILSYVRLIYPVTVIAFSWNSLNSLIPLIYGNYWTTSLVVHFDSFLFGTYPTVWCEQFYRPWLDEIMNVFYCGYYLLMPVIF